MNSKLTKFALTATLGLAITLTLFACEEKEKKQTTAETPTAKPAAKVGEVGTLTDSRDGKKYKTVIMPDGETWMAENMNYAKGGLCYDDKESNCAKYGRLYNWETAMKVCPNGWKLPSQQEWENLAIAIGGDISNEDCYGCYEVTKLKSKSGWKAQNSGNSGNGTDDFGFSALPGGEHCNNCDRTFDYDGIVGNWWTSTEYETDGSDIAYEWRINNDFYIEKGSNSDKVTGYSVRCIKD